MGLLADRIRETTTTTGTGAFALAGAYPAFQTFLQGFGSGASCYYVAQAVDTAGTPTGQWEYGRGTVGNGTLSRDLVLGGSSGAGVLVDFAYGTKEVYCDAPARVVDTYVHEQDTAAASWTVAHGLGKFPSVTVVDSSGRRVRGAVQYLDRDTVQLDFRSAFGGVAYLN